ncbi:MAG: segregation and condensation protein A [Candidatus Sumerlaeaceae bacterium]
MTYTIKLPVFEGPFDLLLHLIRVNEMDIHDIKVAQITQQYLEYLDIMRELDLDLAGEFLVMAATLIHIKARTLLPVPPEQEEHEEEIDEILSAKQLVRQLVEYRRFKEAAVALREKEDQASKVLFRNNPVVQIQPDNNAEMTADIQLLYKAFSRVLRFVEAPVYDPHMVEKYSVEDKIAHIEDLLEREKTFDLENVFRRCFNKNEVIVTFLALLELCRMKRLVVQQENPFDKIMVTAQDGQLEYDIESES